MPVRWAIHHSGGRVLLGVPAGVLVRLSVGPGLLGVGVAVDTCVRVRVPVPAREWVAVPVDGRVWVGDPVPAGDRVCVGVAGTHAPQVSPGNPGAPGVDAAGTYPGAQVPE